MSNIINIPSPQLLYVHENLLAHVRERFSIHSTEYQLANAFIAHVAAEPNVQMGTLEEELAALIAQGTPEPFDVTLGFGRKGERIAQLLHEQWGSFPNIHRLEITRIEKADGSGHELISKTDVSVVDQIAALGDFTSVALVDDVLFTGFTVSEVLKLLPKKHVERCHFFGTRGMAQTARKLERNGCKTWLGVSLEGEPEVDVSTISSMNLITKGAIHSPTEGDITYCQRQEWVEAWFPQRTSNIVDLCEVVTNLVRSFSPREETEEQL
ncbi:MAG: hypothetical protein WCX61_05725 [Candidatus Peribacteraceae bacterium]|jgi:hypothetical protein